jgi:hypothetical protein
MKARAVVGETTTIRMSEPDCFLRARLWALGAYNGDKLIVDHEDLARAAKRVLYGKDVEIEVKPPTPAEIAALVGQDIDDFD